MGPQTVRFRASSEQLDEMLTFIRDAGVAEL